MFDFSLVIFTRLCYSFYAEHSFFFYPDRTHDSLPIDYHEQSIKQEVA